MNKLMSLESDGNGRKHLTNPAIGKKRVTCHCHETSLTKRSEWAQFPKHMVPPYPSYQRKPTEIGNDEDDQEFSRGTHFKELVINRNKLGFWRRLAADGHGNDN
ncbi:unnamed protein product, partial [Dovyalis caffra]